MMKIIGSAKYLPKNKVLSTDIDRQINKPLGWVQNKSGIEYRFFAGTETASNLACKAIIKAVQNSGLKLQDIECIIAACGTMEQAIPCNAALMLEQLNKEYQINKISCFDINSTCLSFIVALDVATYLIAGNRYKNILIVSSEVGSPGLDFKDDIDTAIMFGDGAAALVVTKDDSQKSKIIASHSITFAEGSRFCEIKAGSRFHPNGPTPCSKKDFYFKMYGKESYKLIFKEMPGFIESILQKANLTMNDIDIIVPHQASNLGLKHLKKILKVPDHKFVNIHSHHANQIAASIPTAMHEAISDGRIQRGNKLLLLGSGAGISIGGIILEY